MSLRPSLLGSDVGSHLGPPDGTYKIIVGIDYGTTYSGISFVTTNKSSDEIVIVSKWPGLTGSAWKTPSVIAYSSENPKIDRNYWGYEVNRNHRQYVWTKLLLDSDIDLAKHDDPLLKQMYGAGFLELPPNKSAKDVVHDFLRELYLFTVATLEKELSPTVFNAMPMDCWITMPAIWSDRAQAATRAAALGAGFGSRKDDQVHMITEPEAAALYALKPYLGSNAIDPLRSGEHILVCDCGGGTVDLVTYEVLATEPLAHKEKCRGAGAKCGSTSVDRRFTEWMTLKFGAAFTSLDLKKRGPGSLFMQAFESAKRHFGHRDSSHIWYEIEPLDMELEAPSVNYDEDEQCVKIPRLVMKAFFDPAVDALTGLIKDQASQLENSCGAKIDRFILVGGFGDSPYLNSRLKEWCDEKRIRRFTCPSDCQAAIVMGAALRGLEGIRPTSIIAKRHYGWSMSMRFREGIDDEANAYLSIFDDEKRCRGRMHWAVEKGEAMDTSFKVEKRVKHSTFDPDNGVSTLKLYSCPLDVPPERNDHFSIRHEGTIVTVLEDLQPAAARWNPRWQDQVYRFHFKVVVEFRSKSGILGFKSCAGGREIGRTSINFEQ
ncbi:hypothetical protein HRR83_003599 [Exophiala dermatitidis]|uniref:Actin-like ATPase domain-containing protein n=2 Tax=Exophiala dermatitidis TaxID=5970 RepID=H6BSP0_EXODN|nr:uncharacterized protein HMPREF1120_01586 [Exophiala dermatitidis NIH/UT8656]KAJ4522436.1 hypothetical protein HRR74_003021 [Exophiala dermatitidis]EHY53392.1 hypothetical protein HMPREF1120_01586 [Exophiala dermatitidis NIH/UT8656]KAJ4529761.1 hypothetical protein HRR73_000789 [Exophiala dermatitidis]KAJ4543072.1 hypothetical protein HRR77_005332 [Exophiala dermatitidis]KAJ4543573.1 hypothetical protein HRR76_001640 [Exophiala dermatitidis]